MVYAGQIETKISATKIIATPNSFLKAEGSVVVGDGIIWVKARKLSYNQRTNSISLTGVSELNDGEGIKFLAPEAEFDEELSGDMILA